MKAISVTVPGSVVTKANAADYIKRIAKSLLDGLTVESSIVLTEIEQRIVSAGFLTWEEVEELEIEAIS